MPTSYFLVKRLIPAYGEPVGVNLATGLRAGKLGMMGASMQIGAGDQVLNRVFSIPSDHSGHDYQETDSNCHGSPYKRSIQILKCVVDVQVSGANGEDSSDDGSIVDIFLSKGVPTAVPGIYNTTAAYSLQTCNFVGGSRISYEIDPKFLPTFVENVGECTCCVVRVSSAPGCEVLNWIQINVNVVYTEVALQDQRV